MRINGWVMVTGFILAWAQASQAQAPRDFPEYTIKNIREVRSDFARESQYEEGIAYLRAWQSMQNDPVTHDDSARWYALKIAIVYTFFDLRQLDSVETELKPVMDIRPESFPEECLQIQNSWGVRLVYGGRYLEAKKHFEDHIALIESETLPAGPAHYCNAIHNLGVVNNQLGDADAALENFRRVEDVMREKEINDIRLSSRVQYNLASTYTSLGQYEQSIKHSRKAHELNVQQFGLDHVESAQSLNSLANHLNLSGDLEGALETYLQALGIYQRIGRTDHLMCSVTLLNTGETLNKLGCPEEGLPYVIDCIKIRRNTYGLRHADIARAYKARGTILGALGRYDEAHASMDTSLMALGYDMSSDHPYSGVEAMFHLFYTLDHRADLFYDQAIENPTEANLIFARDAYTKGIAVLNDMRVHFKGKLAKGNLNEKSYGFYEPAIDLCVRLYELNQNEEMLHQAFRWSVESKDNDFYDLIRGEDALMASGVPDSVRDAQDAFLERLAELESAWYDATQDAENIDAMDEARQNLDHEKGKFRTWLQDLETTYPVYYELLYATPKMDIDAVKRLLRKSNSQIIEYFIGDEAAFAFVVNQLGVKVARLPLADTLNAAVLRWRSNLDNPLGSDRDLLSELLWKPVTPLLTRAEHLVVIPDGVLHTVPFETLRYRDKLLLDQFSVSYESSTRMITIPVTSSVNSQWLGIAPEYNTDAGPFAMASRGLDSAAATLREAGWIRLPGAAQEVTEIGSILEGDYHVGKSATERLFRTIAGDYGIVHLSMHAWTDDAEPLLSGLIFSDDEQDSTYDGRLYAHEIFQLKLPASMIILSACNTGIGSFTRGEGIASLAKAFRFAGTQATVMSLWKVPDESTAIIMKAFYQHLKKGERKDEALRHAKLDYLDSVTEPELKRQYYWAGFVLMGDTTPIFQIGISSSLLLILGIIGCIAIGFVFMRRKTPST
jgi:CHAT domain-containing protein/tetratricopeptide (TPR) repeat protein